MDSTQRDADIAQARRNFETWAEAFQVYKYLSIDDPFPEEGSTDHIWTEVWREIYGIDGLNSAAIITPYSDGDFQAPGVNGFYFSKVSHKDFDLEGRVIQALLFPCAACVDGEDGWIDDDCQSCGGVGDEYFFELPNF